MVARRDMTATAKSKSFIISTAITLICILLAFVIVSAVSSDSPGPLAGLADDTELLKVAVVGEQEDVVTQIPGLELVEAADSEAATEMVRSGEVEAAILAPAVAGNPLQVVGDETVPDQVVDGLTSMPEVLLLNPPRVAEMARYWLSLAFGILYLMLGAMYGQMIAMNTVVEKQTRIVEILLAAVPTRAMLAGKIIGGSILAVGETVAIVGVCYLGMRMNNMTSWLELVTAPMWWYVAFFLVGFVMYASMFTAAGAMVSRTEDLGGASTPIIMLVMAPYFLVLALNGSDTAMTIMSYVPFTSPVAMPVQLVIGDAGPIQAVISLAILAVTAVGIGAGAARIYANSVLQTGSRLKLRQAFGSKPAARAAV
jgi:ABC-2 type transport system permease protein